MRITAHIFKEICHFALFSSLSSQKVGGSKQTLVNPLFSKVRGKGGGGHIFYFHYCKF